MHLVALLLSLVIAPAHSPRCETFAKQGVASGYTVTVCDGVTQGRGTSW